MIETLIDKSTDELGLIQVTKDAFSLMGYKPDLLIITSEVFERIENELAPDKFPLTEAYGYLLKGMPVMVSLESNIPKWISKVVKHGCIAMVWNTKKGSYTVHFKIRSSFQAKYVIMAANIYREDEEANRFPRPLDINKFRNRPDHLKEAGDERVKKGFSFLKAERQSENLGSGITTSASDTRTDITELQRVMVAKSKFLAEGFKPTHLLVTKEIFGKLIAEIDPVEINPTGEAPSEVHLLGRATLQQSLQMAANEKTIKKMQPILDGHWDSICLSMRVEAHETDLDIITRQYKLADEGKTAMAWKKDWYQCVELDIVRKAYRGEKVNHE